MTLISHVENIFDKFQEEDPRFASRDVVARVVCVAGVRSSLSLSLSLHAGSSIGETEERTYPISQFPVSDTRSFRVNTNVSSTDLKIK